MTAIADLIASGPTLSFEFFPPKTPDGEARLDQTVADLTALAPAFVSVTYGAGGSTRDRTEQIVTTMAGAGDPMPMPHLTCIGHSRAELVAILERYRDAGLSNILALHGDPPRHDPHLPQGDLTRAAELVELAREVGDFCVAVAAHPEGHPKAPDPVTDRDHQAAKLAIADFALTQFFFEAEHYHRLVEDMAARGVDTPIVPGIIPVTNTGQAKRFADMSGAAFPTWLGDRLESVEDDPEAVKAIGIEVAAQLCTDLLEAGAPGIHLYTLNRSEACAAVVERLPIGTPRT